jgi:sensor histidine kinase YesM
MYSLLFVLIMIFAVALFSVYIYNNTSSQIITSLEEFSATISAQMEDKFNQMDRISARLFFSQNILNLIEDITFHYEGTQNYFDQRPEQQNMVFRNLLLILGLDITNTVINIYTDKSFVTTAQSSTDWSIIKHDAGQGILAEAESNLRMAPGSSILLGPHKAYWVSGPGKYPEYYSISRKLYNFSTGRTLGTLQILKPHSDIENLCNSSDRTIRIFMFDKSRSILNNLSQNDEIVLDAKALLANGGSLMLEKGRYTGKSGKNYLISFNKIGNYNYSILIMQQYQSGLKIVYIGAALIAVLFLFIVSISLNFLISRYLTRPLDQIIQALRLVTRDNLEMNIDFHSSTEDLKQLQLFYNEMLRRVKEAMNQTLQSKLHEREAYYLALQSQMSPHFLYNCISNINAIAYENNLVQITDICSLLSNMLRYAMSFDLENSTIGSELEYTCNYLKLMQIRYANDFIFSVNMDEGCRNFPIPRLMLQTIVENCFKHGFPQTSFPWLININIFSSNRCWIIEVMDNGIGIDGTKIDEITAQSQELFENILQGIEELHLGGLGLLNSITRLRLLYNNKILFSAKSMYRGTIVQFGGEVNEK